MYRPIEVGRGTDDGEPCISRGPSPATGTSARRTSIVATPHHHGRPGRGSQIPRTEASAGLTARRIASLNPADTRTCQSPGTMPSRSASHAAQDRGAADSPSRELSELPAQPARRSTRPHSFVRQRHPPRKPFHVKQSRPRARQRRGPLHQHPCQTFTADWLSCFERRVIRSRRPRPPRPP